MGPWRLSLCLVTALAAAAPAAAKDRRPKFNVDFALGWEGSYRPMEWTPIHVTISTNLKKPLGGTLRLSVPQDELTRMTIDHPIVLTPDIPLHVPLVMKAAFAASECRVAIFEGRTRLWEGQCDLWSGGFSGQQGGVIGKDSLLVGVAGRSRFGLTDLPARSVCVSPEGRGRVWVRRKPLRTLPWDWTGYDSLDLLVLYDVDYQQMADEQARAVVRWVGNGGSLLLVLGARPLVPEHPIASLLPFRLGPVRQVELPSDMVRRWGCSPVAADRGNTVACWSMPAEMPPGWEVPLAAPDAALFAWGPVGFGRVGVLACDPATLGGRQRENLAGFWVRLAGHLLAERGIAESAKGFNEDGAGRYEYDLGVAGVASNAVLRHLLSIPELRPISIWVVIALLLSLAVVIGPVDYFVLKRLDRLPLTWITSAACVLLFTVGAYYGVQALRGGSAQVRVVSVVDGVDGAGGAWSTAYSGIFAPANDDYRLSGLRPDQWWSSMAPTRGDHAYAGGFASIGREVSCVQTDGGNLPVSVPINIWTMQCFVTEAPAGGVPFRASLERTGEQAKLKVANLADVPIRGGCVRIGPDRLMRFGAVPRKSTREFTAPAVICGDWQASAGLGPRYDGDPGGPAGIGNEQAFFAWGSLRRTRAMQAYLRRGAAVVCARYDGAPVEFGLTRRREIFDHVQLARLVVFPQEGAKP